MIRQQGQVVRKNQKSVSIRVGARGGCPTCEAGKGCGGGIFARLIRKSPVVLEVPLRAGDVTVRVGQQVSLGVRDFFFLRWTSLFFGLPLVSALLAASLTQFLFFRFWPQGSTTLGDLLVLVSALLAGGLSLYFVRSRALSRQQLSQQLYLLDVVPGNSCPAANKKT